MEHLSDAQTELFELLGKHVTDPLWWQVATGIVGSLLLAASLFFSARATRSAMSAARAAEEVLKAERAWLTPFGLEHPEWHTNAHLPEGISPKAVGFSIIWKNTGRSPALNARVYNDIKLRSKNDTNVPIFSANANDDTILNQGAIGQGIHAITSVRFITFDDYERFMSSEIVAYLYSKITYYDLFSEEKIRESEVCYRIKWRGWVKDEAGKEHPQLETQVSGSQNSVQ